MSLETMTKLASTTVGVGGTTTVTFSNIPQGYTDLKVLMSARTAGSNGGRDYAVFRIHGDTTTAFNRKWMYGYDNNVSGSGSNTTETFGSTITLPDSAVTNLFSNNQITFYNYSSNNYKTIVSETNATKTASATFMLAFSSTTWQNSAPITSLSFTAVLNGDSASLTGTFVENSTFTLYGVKNAAKTAGKSIKATGGNIIFDGTYTYHVFNGTDVFTPTQSLIADALVVAGGGGNGRYAGGGGGAGGVVYFAKQNLTTTSYAVTVGSGGAASPSDGSDSSNGSNSNFGSLTAAVGGGGGGGNSSGNPQRVGKAGGSGGGGGGSSGTAGGASTQTGTGATLYYGNAGGQGVGYAGAGGGGAGAAAGTAGVNTNYTGNGGIGISHELLNAVKVGELYDNNYYVGGGGYGFVGGSAYIGRGGIGGGGGGPSLADTQLAANGILGTGGGGGSTGTSTYYGNGGSGVVIIRYKG